MKATAIHCQTADRHCNRPKYLYLNGENTAWLEGMATQRVQRFPISAPRPKTRHQPGAHLTRRVQRYRSGGRVERAWLPVGAHLSLRPLYQKLCWVRPERKQ